MRIGRWAARTASVMRIGRWVARTASVMRIGNRPGTPVTTSEVPHGLGTTAHAVRMGSATADGLGQFVLRHGRAAVNVLLLGLLIQLIAGAPLRSAV